MWCSAVGSIVTLLLSLLVVPLAAAAPPAGKVWRIGYLVAGFGEVDEAFRQGLRDLGYVEGQNITIEYRHADNQCDRLPALAAELVRLPVDILVTAGENAARAVQQATRAIPIVLASGSDPVELGLVASLARPGGNLTGLSLMNAELDGKRLELLKEAVPTASRVGVLFNPTSTGAVPRWRETENAARSLGMQLHALEVRRAEELERAFAAATSAGVGALIVWRNFLIDTHRTRILQLATQRRLPVMAELREYVTTVASCSMARACLTSTAARPPMWIRSSKAPRRRTCQWSSLRSSSWSSIARRHRPSGSRFPRRSSSWRTRCSKRQVQGSRTVSWNVEEGGQQGAHPAEPSTAADALQRPLRSRLQARLSASVRPQNQNALQQYPAVLYKVDLPLK
jgi:putative ABC transport system substrate-binding protein